MEVERDLNYNLCNTLYMVDQFPKKKNMHYKIKISLPGAKAGCLLTEKYTWLRVHPKYTALEKYILYPYKDETRDV